MTSPRLIFDGFSLFDVGRTYLGRIAHSHWPAFGYPLPGNVAFVDSSPQK